MCKMRLLCLFCLFFFLGGCFGGGTPTPKTEPEIPRPAPGYMQWMKKESMLGHAPDLIAQVSQTRRIWLQSGEPDRADVLLKAAPNWMELAGIPENPKSPVFRELKSQLGAAAKMGFGGLYLGETGERPDIWVSKDGSLPSQKPASINFDSRFGEESDFEKLADAAEAAKMQIGSDMLAAATGRGPDFFLQARNALGHSGLYAFLPVPEEAVEHLPLTREEWDNQPLPAVTVEKLVDMGVLPSSVARDSLEWASKGGWAVTGPVMGSDGVPRRWLYRFSESSSQPVLSWQDPSGQTARVFNAAAILQTGIQGQSLVGLHFEPIMALEPGAARTSLSPGLAALNEIARQIHRYGGWAMQADALPLSAMTQVLQGPCDFCRDDLTPLLVAFGLVMADGRPVAQLYRDWMAANVDISRMARGYNEYKGLNPKLLLDNPAWIEQGQTLLELGSVIRYNQIARQVFSAPDEEQAELIRRFLLTWRLGLPGLGFVEFYPNSFIQPSDGWLEHILESRRKSGLALARAHTLVRGRGGGLGLLSALPNGGYWLLACNFGRNPDEINITLPGSVAHVSDAGTAEDLSAHLRVRNFRLPVGGREARNVLFEPIQTQTAGTNP